jgi:hypothetical protein
MRKLRLEMDDLAVTSFPTEERPALAPGTVEGAQAAATADATCTKGGATCLTSCAYFGPCTCAPGTTTA